MTDLDPENGTVTREEGVLVLRFERMLAHPVAKVWAALTDPAECACWLGDLGVDLVQHGPFALSADGEKIANGIVTELRAPDGEGAAVVEYTWHASFSDVGSAVIRWELRPVGDRTRLILTQTAASADFLAEGAAGWHGFLDQLAQALTGEDGVADQVAWRARRARYSTTFAVPMNPAIP